MGHDKFCHQRILITQRIAYAQRHLLECQAVGDVWKYAFQGTLLFACQLCEQICVWGFAHPPCPAEPKNEFAPLSHVTNKDVMQIRRPSWRRAGGGAVYFLTSYFLRLYILKCYNISYTFRSNISPRRPTTTTKSI